MSNVRKEKRNRNKERLAFTASSSKPYLGSTAVREEEVSDGAGDKIHASKDAVGE